MVFLGASGIGTIVATPMFFWGVVVAAVALVIAIGMGMEMLIASGRTRKELIHLVTDCGIHGHSYTAHYAGWQCVTCGEQVIHDLPLRGETTVPSSMPALSPLLAVAGSWSVVVPAEVT